MLAANVRVQGIGHRVLFSEIDRATYRHELLNIAHSVHLLVILAVGRRICEVNREDSISKITEPCSEAN